MSYFTAVRIYSIAELCIFAALVTFAIGGWSEQAETILGWTHGFGWILLCLLVFYGATRHIFTWVTLALTVSPAGPLGSTLGIEYQARSKKKGESQPLSTRGGSSPGSGSQADGG